MTSRGPCRDRRTHKSYWRAPRPRRRCRIHHFPRRPGATPRRPAVRCGTPQSSRCASPCPATASPYGDPTQKYPRAMPTFPGAPPPPPPTPWSAAPRIPCLAPLPDTVAPPQHPPNRCRPPHWVPAAVTGPCPSACLYSRGSSLHSRSLHSQSLRSPSLPNRGRRGSQIPPSYKPRRWLHIRLFFAQSREGVGQHSVGLRASVSPLWCSWRLAGSFLQCPDALTDSDGRAVVRTRLSPDGDGAGCVQPPSVAPHAVLAARLQFNGRPQP